jgi:dTDP-4-dehydrorhamnose reductase
VRILILGASGRLGSRLFHLLQDSHKVSGTFNLNGNESTNLSHWDGNSQKLFKIIEQFMPEVIINCMGFSKVDQSEILPEKAFYLNATIPHKISEMCESLSIKFIHISTDHFIGDNYLPLTEDMSVVCPNVYSETKFLGESFVRLVNENSVVIRANFFHFSKNTDDSYINKCLNNIGVYSEINGFVNIYFTPVSTLLLRNAIIRLIESNFSGLINISSNESISKFDFLKNVLSIAQIKNTVLHPKNYEEKDLLAVRPKNMKLANIKYRNLVDSRLPSIDEMIEMELRYAEFI